MISRNKIKHLWNKVNSLIYTRLTGFIDRVAYALNIPVRSVPPVFYTKGIIVYVCDFNWPRVSRMSKWLKRTEPSTICLLCSKKGYNVNFDISIYDGVAFYRNAWHLRRMIRGIKDARLIQGFGPLSYNPTAALKETKCTYVYDIQDAMVSYQGINPTESGYKHDMPAEKYALEYSNGVIAESTEIQNAYRTYHINKKPPTLFFPLCCDNDTFKQHAKPFNPKDIHLVYAGQIHGSWRDSRVYGLTKFFNIIDSFTAQGIHLHVYPSPTNVKADYEEYMLIAKNNPYFHFHTSVSQERLSEELTQYDFGLLPFFKSMGGPSDTKFKYATTLKLFNYWESSLPIIVSEDLFYQSWLVQRYGGGIALNKIEDLDRLGSIIANYSYPRLIQNVLAAREHISLKNNIKRLVNFYNAL